MAIELWRTPALQHRRHYWGIVLAGGEGKRLRDFLRNEYNQESPKQFCAIIGKRSMLKHTLDRAASLIPEHRLLTVISRQHLLYAIEDICTREPKTVITVPVNRDTAPSILLSLVHIYNTDPNATAAIFPSDHFILEEDIFMDYVSKAFEFSTMHPDKIVTLGVIPTGSQTGYGWIEKGNILSSKSEVNFYRVRKFHEKPDGETMHALLSQDCVWNTMTMIGKVAFFIQIFKECIPELCKAFERIAYAVGTPFETEVVSDVFETLPALNFSHVVLERIPQHLAVLPMHNVYWNDWGEEQRIRYDLQRFVRNDLPQSPEEELNALAGKEYSIELLPQVQRQKTAVV
ncbi:MAG: sugar phosphate nucleotidyltransferase [Bacteroidota bacterium]